MGAGDEKQWVVHPQEQEGAVFAESARRVTVGGGIEHWGSAVHIEVSAYSDEALVRDPFQHSYH